MQNGSSPPSPGRTPAVECRDVWKVFGPRANEALAAVRAGGIGKSEALERYNAVIGVAGASLTVARGEIFCIMGLSGSGKSTLVRHINGLIAPTAGEVLIDGEPIGTKSPAELRRLRAEKIGMVFQSFALLPHRTVLDNAAFPLELRGLDRAEREAIARKALAEVQLTEWAEHLPAQLSGGMQQRVGLARALAGDPQILLMDEPFGALDPLIRRQMQDQFLELSRRHQKTTIFITHDLEEAMRLGSRIAIMRDGAIIQIGSPSEIVRKPADRYVADFVSGLSRMKLLRAGDIMRPVGDGSVGERWPRAKADSALEDLVGLAIDSEQPIVVLGADGRPAGLIDRQALLRGLSGRVAHG